MNYATKLVYDHLLSYGAWFLNSLRTFAKSSLLEAIDYAKSFIVISPDMHKVDWESLVTELLK